MADETYVENGAWIRQVGRPDLIDEVADQFERPTATSARRSSHGRHSIELRHERIAQPA